MTVTATQLGQRIADARRRAGLTQLDASAASGIDRTALAKIESGLRRVTALELAHIASVIGERIEWFVTDSPEAIVAHRNLQEPGEPSPQIDAAIARIARDVEFVASLDEQFATDLPAIPEQRMPADNADADRLAVTARSLIGASPDEPIIDIADVLARAGLITFALNLGPDSADAATVLLTRGGVAVINAALRTGRRRLAAAHEFGHLLIADDYSVDWRIDGSGSVDSRERLLDRFARALLLPTAAILDEWNAVGQGSRRATAIRIASRYRVDMSTLARRLTDLGLVNASAAQDIRQYRTTRGDIVTQGLLPADELSAGSLPLVYEQAVLRLRAAEIVNTDRALELLQDAWDIADLPPLPTGRDTDIWQFVS